MKKADFAQRLETYLRKYMPGQAGLSENTVMAYRDTFILIVEFLEKAKKQNPDKVTLADFNAGLTEEFPDWLETERHNSTSTHNQRLAAIRAFAKHRRDLALLNPLYDSAARVQEICDLRVRDVRLQKPYIVKLTGKENRLNVPRRADSPFFFNHKGGFLTRAGITYILKKYCNAARKEYPGLPEKISPHVMRHSKAMHMLQAGMPLTDI